MQPKAAEMLARARRSYSGEDASQARMECVRSAGDSLCSGASAWGAKALDAGTSAAVCTAGGACETERRTLQHMHGVHVLRALFRRSYGAGHAQGVVLLLFAAGTGLCSGWHVAHI